jgi:hypothetical protein
MKDPKDRITIEKALKHPFITDEDTPTIYIGSIDETERKEIRNLP